MIELKLNTSLPLFFKRVCLVYISTSHDALITRFWYFFGGGEGDKADECRC